MTVVMCGYQCLTQRALISRINAIVPADRNTSIVEAAGSVKALNPGVAPRPTDSSEFSSVSLIQHRDDAREELVEIERIRSIKVEQKPQYIPVYLSFILLLPPSRRRHQASKNMPEPWHITPQGTSDLSKPPSMPLAS